MQVLFAEWSFENTATVLLSKTAIVSRGEFVSLLGPAFLRGQRAVTCGVWGGCVRRVTTRTPPEPFREDAALSPRRVSLALGGRETLAL